MSPSLEVDILLLFVAVPASLVRFELFAMPQVACAIKEVVGMAGSDGAHIICGDFNSEWSSPVYQLVLDGYLSDSSIQTLQAVQRLELNDGAVSWPCSVTLKLLLRYSCCQAVTPFSCTTVLLSQIFMHKLGGGWLGSCTDLYILPFLFECNCKYPVLTQWSGADKYSLLLLLLLLGGSGEVVNSLDFCLALAAYTSGAYFLHNGRW